MNAALKKVLRYGRQTALTAAQAVGAFDWVASSRWRQHRLLILCYHGVSLLDEHEWDDELFVTPEFLRQRFEMLRRNRYNVLPLGTAVEAVRTKSLPERAVAITFDDGFYNFAARAVPLLEEFKLPATVYASTYYALHQRPLLGLVLRYLLWRARARPLPAGILPPAAAAPNLQDPASRERVAVSLLDVAHAPEMIADRAGQLAWVELLAGKLGVDWQEIMSSRRFHLMTPEELRQVARRGISVELHTHKHRTPRIKDEFRSEVLDNRRVIEDATHRPAVHFCYPSGDIDASFLPWLRDLGVRSATTCEVGLAHAGHDSLLLPRYIDTMRQSRVIFSSWLSGVAEFSR